MKVSEKGLLDLANSAHVTCARRVTCMAEIFMMLVIMSSYNVVNVAARVTILAMSVKESNLGGRAK